MITIDAADQSKHLAGSIRHYTDTIVINHFNLPVKYFPKYVDDIVECANLIVFFFTANNNTNVATTKLFKDMYVDKNGVHIQYEDRIIKIEQ